MSDWVLFIRDAETVVVALRDLGLAVLSSGVALIGGWMLLLRAWRTAHKRPRRRTTLSVRRNRSVKRLTSSS